VLPEVFNSPFGNEYFAKYAEPIPGPSTEWVSPLPYYWASSSRAPSVQVCKEFVHVFPPPLSKKKEVGINLKREIHV
jgi:hypothetical protein